MKPEIRQLHELSNEGLQELFQAIKALGFDDATAGDYAARIGDNIIRDQDGKIVVMDDHGKVLARLTLDYFD